MSAKQLRAVRPGETPPAKASRQSVAEAAASGDQLATLIATRDRVAVAISSPECSPRDLAALTKRLDDIIEKIKTLDAARESAGVERAVPDDTFDAAAL